MIKRIYYALAQSIVSLWKRFQAWFRGSIPPPTLTTFDPQAALAQWQTFSTHQLALKLTRLIKVGTPEARTAITNLSIPASTAAVLEGHAEKDYINLSLSPKMPKANQSANNHTKAVFTTAFLVYPK